MHILLHNTLLWLQEVFGKYLKQCVLFRQASKKVAILVMLHIFRLDFAFTPH